MHYYCGVWVRLPIVLHDLGFARDRGARVLVEGGGQRGETVCSPTQPAAGELNY